MTMDKAETREKVIECALADYDDGHYMAELRRRVAIPTESQNPERLPDLYRYGERTPAELLYHSRRPRNDR